MTSSLVEAYAASAASWDSGPGVIYDRLAQALVGHGRVLAGSLALDAGTGSGAAARALEAAGARVVATDLAHAMLASPLHDHRPRVVGDVRRLPLRSGVFDAAVSAFVVNHVAPPETALAELARVCRAGGQVLVSAFAAGIEPAVKGAVDIVATSHGWQPPRWYVELKAGAVADVGAASLLQAALTAAGLVEAQAWVDVVRFDDVSPEVLAAWRLGMPSVVGFVERLDAGRRAALVDDARAAVRDCPPVELHMVVGRARVDARRCQGSAAAPAARSDSS